MPHTSALSPIQSHIVQLRYLCWASETMFGRFGSNYELFLTYQVRCLDAFKISAIHDVVLLKVRTGAFLEGVEHFVLSPRIFREN